MATLTYAYADQTAVVGPLAAAAEPHSWDLCENHAHRITAPWGWELVRYDLPVAGDDEDLTALAEAVREAGRNATGLVLRDEGPAEPDAARHPSAHRPASGRHRRTGRHHLHVVPDPEEPSTE